MTLVWLRQDLRLDDQPALRAAAARGAVVPVFIHEPVRPGAWPPGGAGRWWLHHSLAALGRALEARGSRLILRSGEPLEVLTAVAAECGATAVFWNRRYEPAGRAVDTRVKAEWRARGGTAESFAGALLWEPQEVANQQGRPFQVFSPFWRHLLTRSRAEPLGPPEVLAAPSRWPRSDPLEAAELLPTIRWDDGLAATWQPGEAGALARLDAFLGGPAAAAYASGRDLPGQEGTSRLSPHLHWGEISPRRVWSEVVRRVPEGSGRETFLREVGWREFASHLLFHFPHTPERALRPAYDAFPWEPDARLLRAWQRGRTGYPIVDAGMRQLYATGWMHNRVRMIVASFLVKHLLQPWRHGAEWFWDTLVDADLAANTLGWQWSAGCGADAAPYFRVFNPVLQGQKFDPDGAYVRRWVPELARLPAGAVHAPWTAGPLVLRGAGIELGGTYPEPVVEHAWARARALRALGQLTGSRPARGASEEAEP